MGRRRNLVEGAEEGQALLLEKKNGGKEEILLEKRIYRRYYEYEQILPQIVSS